MKIIFEEKKIYTMILKTEQTPLLFHFKISTPCSKKTERTTNFL